MLEKFGMETSKDAKIPMMTCYKMDPDEAGQSVDQTKYKGLFGSLLYLTISGPDISFAKRVCARFLANHKKSHMEAAKNILKYLKGTVNLGL